MKIDLTNKTALVTGASRGIGRAIAIQLGQAGARVVGTATSDAGASGINDAFQAEGVAGFGAVLDIASPDSIAALMQRLTEEQAAPDILVNNAGITRDGLLLRMSDADWDAVLNTNLGGVFRLSKACLRGMTKAKWGRIITITSVVGLTGNPGQANYAAAKAGVIAFTKSLAKEVAARGVTANTVAPGYIETDMTKALNEEKRAAFLQNIPAKRGGLPEEIAAAVAFLASPQAAYITGETLHVNGGMYMA